VKRAKSNGPTERTRLIAVNTCASARTPDDVEALLAAGNPVVIKERNRPLASTGRSFALAHGP